MNITIEKKNILIPVITSLLVSFFILIKLPFVSFALVISIILSFVLTKKIEYGLYLILIWIPLQYLLTKYYYSILPNNFVWIDEVILAMMFIITLLKIVSSKTKLNISSLDIFVLIFIIIAVISAIINLVNPLTGAMGVRAFLQYYILYFVIKNIDLNTNVHKNLVLIILFTFAIQIPFSIYQFFTWSPRYLNPLTGYYVNKYGLSHYDSVVGTFGSGAANNFGYLLVMIIIMLLAAYIYLKNNKYLILALFLIIPLVFSQSRGTYIVAIFLLFYTFRKSILNFKNISKLSISIILIGILFSFCMGVYFKYSKYKFENLFNIEGIIKQQMTISQASSGRIIGIKIADDILSEKAPSRLFGVGPGMFSSTTGIFFSSPLYVETVNKLRSNRAITENDVVPMMTEYGYLGLITFIIIIMSMIKKNIDIHHKTQNKYLKAITSGGDGVLFSFLIGALLYKVWEIQYIAYYVWLYMGYIENMSLKETGSK